MNVQEQNSSSDEQETIEHVESVVQQRSPADVIDESVPQTLQQQAAAKAAAQTAAKAILRRQQQQQQAVKSSKGGLNCVLIYLLFVVFAMAGFLVVRFFQTTAREYTFPNNMHTYKESEMPLVRQIPGRQITSTEITSGVLYTGVLISDMNEVMTEAVEYNRDMILLPINYGSRHTYSAIAFYADEPKLLLNPYISTSSGLVTVNQRPLFCDNARDYSLPSHVVVEGSPHNSTVITRVKLEGAHAAMVYTLVHQLQGIDVCNGWN